MSPVVYVALLSTACAWCRAHDMFPEALMFGGLGLSGTTNGSGAHENGTGVDAATVATDADLSNALVTMSFHREKLNDYLCRQYIVDKILHDISGGTDYNVSSESRSMPSDYHHGVSKTMTMQTDQGSSAYSTWLTKTELLRKIYDEYDWNAEKRGNPVGFTSTHKNGTGEHDRDNVQNSADGSDETRHPDNDDLLSSSSETVIVDVAQSQSAQYFDVDGEPYGIPQIFTESPQQFPPYHGTRSSPSQYGNPPVTYGPPSPTRTYGPSSPTYEPPSPTYGPPTLTYGPPSPSHGAPSPTYGPPTPTYGPPAPTYGPLSPSHGAPSPTYGPPTPTYGPHLPSHGAPWPFDGPPPQTYGPSSPTHGAPSPTDGHPPPTHGLPSPTDGHPPPTYGLPSPTYGPPSPIYGFPSPPDPPPPASYGPPPASSYRPPKPSSYYGQAPSPSNGYPPSYNGRPPAGTALSGTDPDPPLTTRKIETLGQLEDSKDSSSNTDGGTTKLLGLTATDLYDLTLTAIAFLGFGTFVMNLVMDTMKIKSGATLMMNRAAVGRGMQQQYVNYTAPEVLEINDLSWAVVSTLDNMLLPAVDGTPVNCVEVKQLCRRSKRLIKTGANLSSKLLPIWNVSLGWLSNKLGTNTGQPAVMSALLGHCTLPTQCQHKS